MTLNLNDDLIDVRDIIARIEELQDMENPPAGESSDESEELASLLTIMENLKGIGGDEQWNGDWYPITLISDSYFEEYAQELADDCGMVDMNAKWPMNCIDWEKAADELKGDYTSVDINGSDYWTR